MLSRVADNIYWMNRYIERAENFARLIDVHFQLNLDPSQSPGGQWRPLVMITGDRDRYEQRYDGFERDSVIEFLTFDHEYPNSILQCVTAARQNARSIREVISSEMWEQINSFYLMVRSPSARRQVQDDPHGFFDAVKSAAHLVRGVTDATMTHGEGWHFGQVGRLLERADKTSRVLDVKYFLLLPSLQDVGSPLDDIQWAALLRSTTGLEMYRKRYGRISPTHIVEFLVLDREFPRAMLHCLDAARWSLHAISGSPIGAFRNPAEQRLGQLHAELAYARTDEIVSGGLHEFLDNTQNRLNLVGDAIFDTFFALRPISAQVSYA